TGGRCFEPSLQFRLHGLAHRLQPRPRLEPPGFAEHFGRLDLEARGAEELEPLRRGVRADMAWVAKFFEIVDVIRRRAILGNKVIDHGGDPVRLEDACHLSDKSSAVGKMMRRYTAGYEIELGVLERQRARVGFGEADIRDTLSADEPLRRVEHLLREVARHNLAHPG